MEEGMLPSRSNRKRPFFEDLEDDDSNKPPKQKKVRFPKGKKVKPGDEEALADGPKVEDVPLDIKDPRVAAKERAKRRSQITVELFNEETNDVSTAEVSYEDNETFVEDGIQIEPFNLEQEREEGYFDAQGNFVEYVHEKEFKDAWLDSVEVDPRYASKSSMEAVENDDKNDSSDLSSEDIGIIKKRIANLLEPGETVLQALRRLKGGSNNRKEKMSAETQRLFDQLTEDANKLLEQGEYNVYHDKKEVFKREAEGYEKLAVARGKGISLTAGQEISDYNMRADLSSDVTELGVTTSKLSNVDVGVSNMNVSAAETSGNGADAFDMFADDDDNASAGPSSSNSTLVSGPNSNGFSQPSSDGQNSASERALQDDYVYDETSRYYYSSSSGYYYDPSTGLYCYASSGTWYSFNEETGTYDEINEVANAN
ncbi:CD2 antigen cytoplasmic tail-binding protein 2 isoform X2 [Jatropha curcas]|uniref:CD2 antigen cytoplasmic tail-binding protein 2 isoform X2 n=1 Tax=Jatropha curcas TaxID=180498 RepID=UPI0005FAA5C1|nr:CD2 antigen cytoplasmic tail-binding protein 2 isoform X2 [Jatropha curcas]